MAATDQTLRDVLARLDALERENQKLREKMAILEGISGASSVATMNPLEQPVSRRRVLRRAAQVTAVAAAAGVLVRTDTRQVAADQGTDYLIVDRVDAHRINVDNFEANTAIYATGGDTNSPTIVANNGDDGRTALEGRASGNGVFGLSYANGAGVSGLSQGGDGVQGLSGSLNASGMYGSNNGGGFGVAGNTTSAVSTDLVLARAGVFGRNNGTGAGVLGLSINGDGDGVRGTGKVGVHGTSASGNGVLGEGGTGYGGVFKGAKSQIRLTPTGRIGKQTTGAHQVGELYLDKVGALYICTVAGTPGTWKTVTVS